MNSCPYCHGYGLCQPRTEEPLEPCPLGHAEIISREDWRKEYRYQVQENNRYTYSGDKHLPKHLRRRLKRSTVYRHAD